MNENEIKVKLDTLSEYQAHRDLLEADKRALLEDVRVPDEVQAIVGAGMKRMSEVEMSFTPMIVAYQEEQDKKLADIVVPEEIKAALAEIDRQRKEVVAARAAQDAEVRARIQTAKAQIQAEVEAQTHGIYTALAQRKAEIEAEFAGKAEAVDDNIRKLTEEIKADVKEIGFTVKSDHFQAVYTKAKKTWIPQRLEAYTDHHPDIKDCYTVGEPSVTLRRI